MFWADTNSGTLKMRDAGNSFWIIIGPLSGISQQIRQLAASVSANALTLTLNPCSVDFRSSSLPTGSVNTRQVGAAISVVVPSGATLGMTNATAARLIILAIDNAGTVELAVVNLAGGNDLTETGVISTTALSGSSNSANIIYSTTARTNVSYRIVGYVDVTETTAGTWVAAPSTVQGAGGQALASMSGLPAGALSYRNWVATSVGVNNLSCVISADEIVLENSSNLPYTARSVSLTINANGTVGAPQSIMQTRAANTFYYIWIWRNATLGVTGVLDNSSTSPTPPTGYVLGDYKARMPGPQLTDGSGTKYLMQQKTINKETIPVLLAGSNTTAPATMSNGAQGTAPTTWAAVAIGAFVPPTATKIKITLIPGSTTATVNAAPSNLYTTTNGSANQAPFCLVVGTSSGSLTGVLVLESTNIYVIATVAGSLVVCAGWEENI